MENGMLRPGDMSQMSAGTGPTLSDEKNIVSEATTEAETLVVAAQSDITACQRILLCLVETNQAGVTKVPVLALRKNFHRWQQTQPGSSV